MNRSAAVCMFSCAAIASLAGCATDYVARTGMPLALAHFINSAEVQNALFAYDNPDCKGPPKYIGSFVGADNDLQADLAAGRPAIFYVRYDKEPVGANLSYVVSCPSLRQDFTFSFEPQPNQEYEVRLANCQATIFRKDASDSVGYVPEPSYRNDIKQCGY